MDEAVVESAGASGRRSVDAGRGLAWWTEAWGLFMKNPGMWLVFGVIFFVGCAVLGFIPVIGGIAAAVLAQVIAGGWMLSAHKLDGGGTLELNDLFSGFKDKLNPLLVLGAVAIVATLIIAAVMFVLGAGAVMGIIAGGANRSGSGMLAGAGFGLLALIVCLGLSFVFAMAFWFAPALVVLRGVEPVAALKQSWSATVANLAAFVVFGVLWIVAAVIASIPFALGWLLLVPLTMLGMYASFRDVFGQA
ncbi:BPSS1780 family membrane protein [Ramlibacter sp. PS4R-6]|uniref:BPSS1780 family membrane protein n=1 Tax=Ramlibacter sp. PS4R-6 TaxID=3133438 RepID=UPI0030AC16A4